MNYPSPSVTAAILNSKRKVLLIRTSKGNGVGTWRLPGGPLKGGNNWLDSLRDEVKDKVGLKVRDPELVGIYSDPAFHSFPSLTPAEFWVSACFLVREYEGTVLLGEGADGFDWFPEGQLPEPLFLSEAPKLLDVFHFNGWVSVR
jgi:ADP-ribose pyrophosphatase YjhB (NUDIX family)